MSKKKTKKKVKQKPKKEELPAGVLRNDEGILVVDPRYLDSLDF